MQKFENGDEVTVTYVEKGKKRDGVHIGMNGLLHVVNLGNSRFCEFCECHDANIRPKQLICDKAREIIKDQESEVSPNYKLHIKSKKMYSELCVFSEHLPFFIYCSYCATNESTKAFKERNLPELNLSTGEIIPVEGKDIMKPTREDVEFLHKELKEKDKTIAEYKDCCDKSIKQIEELNSVYVCTENNKDAELNIYKKEVLSLNEQLQEKDAEIEKLVENQDKLNSIIIEKDAEIERLKKIAHRACNLEKSKDKTIERLKKCLDSSNNQTRELNKALKEIDRLSDVCKERHDSLTLINDESSKYIL